MVVQSVGFGAYNRRKPSTERYMRLYLVQHGEAVAKEVDPDRPLSEHGREDIVRLKPAFPITRK